MYVEMHIYRKQSHLDYPRVVKIPNSDKVVFISRVYDEPAARDERDGWSDWSEKGAPYYKFKYTKGGIRAVFIVPKTTQVTLDEFKRISKYKWFWKIVHSLTAFDVCLKDVRSDRDILVALTKLLQFRDDLINVMYHAGSKLKKFIENIMRVVRYHEIPVEAEIVGVFDRMIVVEITEEFQDISIGAVIYIDDVAGSVPVREYVRAIYEFVRPSRYVPLLDGNIEVPLSKLIKAYAKIASTHEVPYDALKKLNIFIKYHQHFRVNVVGD